MEALKISKDEIGVSKHIHLTHLNEPTVFELDTGQVGCTITIKGVAFDTATNQELNSYKRILHQAITMLGEDFCIYGTTIRNKMDVNLSGDFSECFTKTVDEKYNAQFKEANLYSNDLYITVLYKGIDAGRVGGTLSFFQKLVNQSVKSAREEYRSQTILKLKKSVGQFMATISVFKPRLLGSIDEVIGYSEIISFHGFFINNLEKVKYRNPDAPFHSQHGFGKSNKSLALYPFGDIAKCIPSKRIFFGDYIEFKGACDQSTFGSMLSIKDYGSDTASVMLDTLLHLDCEFIYTNSFAIYPNDVAQGKITKQLVRMENAKDPAVSQINQLSQCQDDIASGRVKVGYHHNSLMLISSDLGHLKEMINKAIKMYADIGFVATQETIGMEPAFWAQIPGNQKYIVRSSLITSRNFVDFCPLHNYRTGYRDSNHLGSAITLIETPSKTPMFFNYHAKGSGDKNDLTPGHTTIIGGNGSGKTVFMGFVDSQMSRYSGRSYFFDRDRGMEIYIRATGGHYVIISPDYAQDVQFNPFSLKDTAKNRSFVKSWLAQLLRIEGEDELPSEIDRSISECVDYAYDSLSIEHRSLTTASKILPVDFPRWGRLKKWLKGEGGSNDGEYAYLFDNTEDKLNLSISKVGFDFTELMNEPNAVLTAVCMYLVHRIKQSLDGQRVSIYFDEGWQILDNDYWKKQLKQDLPTLRKLNAHIVLATQSPESVISSTLSAQFLDNCATNIFFCNPNADFERHYKYFNITESEFDFIKNTPKENRLFLYKQSDESAICKLNLSNMNDEMAIYSANKSTIKILDQVRKEMGDNPKKWIPEFHKRRIRMESK